MNPPAPKLRKHYAETARGLVHVQACGAGERSLAVLSMTSFGDVVVGRLLAELAGRGWHALAFDLMGYGRSDRRDTVWRVEDFADNIEQAFAALGLAPLALVCGHFASWAGIEIASRHPAGLGALVLDGTPVFDAARRAENLAAAPTPPLAWNPAGAHASEYWRRAYRIVAQLDPGCRLPAEGAVPEQRFREACLAVIESMAFEPGTMEAANRYAIEQRLPRIEVPVLLSCGDLDWNLKHHAGLLAALPGAAEVRWPGIHPLHELGRPERAAEYAARIDAFLSGLGIAAAPTPPTPARSTP